VDRPGLKRAARTALRRHYLPAVVAVILLVFLVNGPLAVSSTVATNEALLRAGADLLPGTRVAAAIDAAVDGLDAVQQATALGSDSSRGKLHAVYVRAEDIGGLSAVTADVTLDLLERVPVAWPGVAARLGLLAGLYVFLSGLVRIGAARFFLEARADPAVPVGRLFCAYRRGRFLRWAGLVALKRACLLLWGLTLVGAVVKHYAWYFSDYVAAANPALAPRDVLRRSAELTRGHKWRLVLFDLSFLPWYLLSVVTFGAVKYLWLDPYYYSARAEVYAALAEGSPVILSPSLTLRTGSAKDLPASPGHEILRFAQDDRECAQDDKGVRDDDNVPCHPGESRDLSSAPAGLVDYFYCFLVFSFVGWVYEVAIEFVELGTFVNRGTMYGPWIPIYGVGGVAIVVLLRRWAGSPLKVFFGAMGIGGVIEWVGAWALWHLRHLVYWDYQGYFLNFQGRVALESLLSFGLMGVAAVEVCGPLVVTLVRRLPPHWYRRLALLLALLFLADIVTSIALPHTGEGITEGN
jgi:hypothetical protein